MANAASFPELIGIKRDGDELTKEQVKMFIDGVMKKDIHDSQLGSMLMAICLKGMNRQEMVHLTESMLNSGDKLSWPSAWTDTLVDKHSSGGVGDKVSLPLAPALAACGMKVPMISGRSLGFTGGTLDKLESIPGYRTNFTAEEIKKALETVGCCIVGQSGSLVPADKLIYSFRDITGTVASIPLQVSSIISKKAAEGLKALVLDVKCGKGSFTKTLESAKRLAHALVATSSGLGIRTTAFITEMDNPLGRCIGNSLEVAESLQCLHGKGPKDLEEVVCELGGELLFLAEKVKSVNEGHQQIKDALSSGKALEKWKLMLKAQNVSDDIITKLCNPSSSPFEVLPLTKTKTELKVKKSGVVSHLDALQCAEVSSALGAGRFQPGDEVFHDVGLQLHVSVGSYVKEGDLWVTVYHREPQLQSAFKNKLEASLVINEGITDGHEIKTRILEKVTYGEAGKVVFPCQ